MGLFLRQDLQLGSSLDSIVGFVDNVAPAATMESGATHIADDLNNMRSIASLHLKADQSLPWYTDLSAPAALEAGVKRGIDENNAALHLIEKKRVLKCVWGLKTIAIASAGDTFDILALGEIPTNTQARVGISTDLGVVVSDESGGFGAASLSEVAGPSAISPKNLVQIVDAGTRDPILDAGEKIYGLLQGEGAADFIMTGTTPVRVQISFVKVNGAGNDLEAITSGAMDGESYDYCYVERVRLEDLNEADFLGGANIDVPAGSTVTRQVGYDNQGATVVSQTTNATLDLAAGLNWEIGDLTSAPLFQVIEGSGGGTSQVNIPAAVDEFDVDAVLNNFDAGISANTGGTRPIDIGVNNGIIESTAGDLEVKAVLELILNDGNLVGEATWTGPGVKLTETQAEAIAYENEFGGEVSLFNAIVQAKTTGTRTKVQAVMTATVAANNDVNGPGTAHSNTDVDLAPFDSVPNSFVQDVEVWVNGELIVNNATSPPGVERVGPGGTPAEGDLQFGFTMKGTGQVDSITQIVNGQ